MALSTAATEFRATLGALNITQTRIARLFNVTTRHVRRWQHSERNVPHTVGLVVNLLSAGVITVSQAEAAAPVPARTNGSAKGEPPAEPASDQSALARAEAAALADLGLTTAEKVIALAPGACRWPCGDPRHPDFYFCGASVVAEPYCEHHRTVMLTAPASLPVAPTLPSALPLEQVIGEIAADAALAIAQALHEFQTDGLSSRTRMHGGDLIARLFELWRVCAGQIDVYAVARARGARLLQERHGKDLDARTIVVLIDAVIEILQQIVRSELNL